MSFAEPVQDVFGLTSIQLKAPLELFVQRLQRMMQPTASGAAQRHGVLAFFVQNKDGQQLSRGDRFGKCRVVCESQVLPKPVNSDVLRAIFKGGIHSR